MIVDARFLTQFFVLDKKDDVLTYCSIDVKSRIEPMLYSKRRNRKRDVIRIGREVEGIKGQHQS